MKLSTSLCILVVLLAGIGGCGDINQPTTLGDLSALAAAGAISATPAANQKATAQDISTATGDILAATASPTSLNFSQIDAAINKELVKTPLFQPLAIMVEGLIQSDISTYYANSTATVQGQMYYTLLRAALTGANTEANAYLSSVGGGAVVATAKLRAARLTPTNH
jgi:hypothetical protein